MPSPLRKNELEALEKISRNAGGTDSIEEPVLDRLLALGLTQLRGGKLGVTSRGTMELTRRKDLLRGYGTRLR